MKRSAKAHLFPKWLRDVLEVLGWALILGVIFGFLIFGDALVCDLSGVSCQTHEDLRQ